MDYFPIFTRLTNKPVLVVGAGKVACRKIRLLLSAGAAVTVVAPECEPQIEIWLSTGEITFYRRKFVASDIEVHWLVIAATSDEATNQSICEEANRKKRFTNVVDDRKRSEFITPAIVDRSPIQIAISSGGDAPVLVRSVKTDLEMRLPEGFGALGKQMGVWREQVASSIKISERRYFWEQLVEYSNIPSLIYKRFAMKNNSPELKQGITQQIEDKFSNLIAGVSQKKSEGYLMVAHISSQDPELLTIKVEQAMQHADTVFFDAGIDDAIISRVRRDADCIAVGNRRGMISVEERDMESRSLLLAQKGQRVVVLTVNGSRELRKRLKRESTKLAFVFDYVPGLQILPIGS